MKIEEALEIMKQVCRDQLLTAEALNTLAVAAMKDEKKEEVKAEKTD